MLSCTLVAACAPADVVRIGVVEDRRHVASTFARRPNESLSDTPIEDGVRLAVRDANDSGGVLVRGARARVAYVVRYASTPEEAAAAAVSLLSGDSVHALVSPLSSEMALPVAALAEASGIPMIAPVATSTSLTTNRRWIFRMSVSTRRQAAAAARFATAVFAARRVVLLIDPTMTYTREAGAHLARALHDARLTVSIEAEIGSDRSEADLRALAARAVRVAPDLVLVSSEPDEARRVAVRFAEAGLRVPFVGLDSWYGAEGPPHVPFYRIGADRMADVETIGALRDRISALSGRTDPEVSVWAHEAARLLLQAITRAGSRAPDDIRRALVAKPSFPSAVGALEFDASGESTSPVHLFFTKGEASRPMATLSGDQVTLDSGTLGTLRDGERGDALSNGVRITPPD